MNIYIGGSLTPRAYTHPDDFQRMKALLAEILCVKPHSTLHPGDLDWRLFTVCYGVAHEDILRLWEDERGQLVGFMFAYPSAGMVDLVIHPSLSGTDAEALMLSSVEQHLAKLVAKGIPQLDMFVFADDLDRRRLLERRGYTGKEHRVHLAQSIAGLSMAPELPQGFRFLDVQALDYAEQRAQLHVDAFAPGSTMNADKYRAILLAPGYDPDLDVVITAPDGRFASFALAWIDVLSKIGVFEPVGTRPEFQRRGLGKAALIEAMRRMQVRGIETATVCTTLALTGTIPFYEAAGFHMANTIWCYEHTEASYPVRQSD